MWWLQMQSCRGGGLSVYISNVFKSKVFIPVLYLSQPLKLYLLKLSRKIVDYWLGMSIYRLPSPFGNCLLGIELLQSPFRMEFSMGSLLRRYQRSLRRHPLFRRHHPRFLWSYSWSLRHCHDPWGDRQPRSHSHSNQRCRLLCDSLNIIKHC